MAEEMHPLGKVHFNELERTLIIEDGVLTTEGEEVSVENGTRRYGDVTQAQDGSFDLSGKS